METRRLKRRRIVVDDSALAARIGERIRLARREAGLTQQKLAEGRYTKAYISALEKGHAKPSMAALNFISQRLGVPASRFIADAGGAWDHLAADLLLASADLDGAVEAYQTSLDQTTERGARADLQLGLAASLVRLERGDQATAPAAEALEVFQSLGRQDEAAQASYWLASAQLQADNRPEARALLQELRAELTGRRSVDQDLRVRVLLALGTIEADEREYRAAIATFEEALALVHGLDLRRRAVLLHALALAERESGDSDAAEHTARESLVLYRAVAAQHDAAVVEGQLALAYLSNGQVERAHEVAIQARTRHEAAGDQRSLAHVTEAQARIAVAEKHYADAIQLATEAREAALRTSELATASVAMLTRAHAEARAGQTDAANESYRIAVDELRARGPLRRLQQGLGEWAELLAGAGRHEEAYALTREALDAPARFAAASEASIERGRAPRARRTTGSRPRRSTPNSSRR